MPDDVLERLAKHTGYRTTGLMWDEINNLGEADGYRREMRELLALLRPGDVLPGGALKVVPVCPTREMAVAGNAEWDKWADDDFEDGSDLRGVARIYRAMLSALTAGEDGR